MRSEPCGVSEPETGPQCSSGSNRFPTNKKARMVGGIAFRSFLPILLAFLCLLPAAGQGKSSTPQESVLAQFATQPEGLIHLDVSVADGAGRPVVGLKSDDFTLLDNGTPQKIISFRSSQAADANARLSEVILVLDQVDLSPAQIALVRRDVAKFLRQNNGHPPIPVSIYWFRRTGLYATSAASTDGNELADEVVNDRAQRELWEIPPAPQGNIGALGARSAKLWDSALRSVYTIAIERKELPGRKALLWFGPGWPLDTGQFHSTGMAFDSLVELSTRVREARIVICQVPIPESVPNSDYLNYIAGVRSLEELDKYPQLVNARFALPVLAIQSGGLIADQAIESAIQSCIRESSYFYTLSFNPAKTSEPDEFHELQMKVQGVTARTSTGYYDEPIFYDQPRIPAKRITVQELAKMLDGTAKERDSELADQLAGLELTERLNSLDLARLMRSLDRKSRAALTGLADQSAFLDPPAAEIVSEAAPDDAAQHAMVLRTEAYLQSVLPRLPDFYAIRTTVEYEQPALNESDTWKNALPDQSLHAAVTEKATLRYRKGREEQETGKRKGTRDAKAINMNFIGAFGPILDAVLQDVMGVSAAITWSRWERGGAGKIAVFHYAARGRSVSYSVVDCCLKGGQVFRATPQYRGEIAVDPQTGAILRLTREAEPGWIVEPSLHPVQPVLSTSATIEYGPVEIGGRSYICPQRGALIMRSRPVRHLTFWDEPFEIYSSYETILDDFSYTDYHKFGSESRILPGFKSVE